MFHKSDDLLKWQKPSIRIFEEPGQGKDDQAIGDHPDVVVSGDRAFIYHLTNPGIMKLNPAPPHTVEGRRSDKGCRT